MSNKKETKERVENEIRDAYMAFTIGVQAADFDKYLKLVVEYIDDHFEEIKRNAQILRESNPRYQNLSKKEFPNLGLEKFRLVKKYFTELHEELENLLLSNGCGTGGKKDKKASCRKVLNTYIKTGFIKPLFEGYIPECKMYLEMKNKDEQKYLKGQVFYQYGSSAASYEQNYSYLPDGTIFRDINLIFETLYRVPQHKLSRENIIGLMVTVPFGESKKFVNRNIELIRKGYLTEEELIQQYNFSNYIYLIKDKTIKNGVKYFEKHYKEILDTGVISKSRYGKREFYERKHNQVDFMMKAISDYPGIIKKDLQIFVGHVSEGWEQEDKKDSSSKRSNVGHQIYRNYLLEESTRIYGTYNCYADKLPWKALVASHIVAFNECEGLGHKEWEYDGDNGLLLSPNIDAYFDKYDISFDDDGNILFPDSDEAVKKEIKQILNKYKLDPEVLNERRLNYLKLHRQRFESKVSNKK